MKINDILFDFSYFIVRKREVVSYYHKFLDTQWWPYDKLKEAQNKQLRCLLSFVNNNIPYYKNFFQIKGINLDEGGKNIDLEKIPILNKKIIKDNYDLFFPVSINKMNYSKGSTGGSTGEPLKYFMSKEDKEIGIALLHRGWNYGGYKPGEKMAIIAGSSLIPSTSSFLKKWFISQFRNIRYYSSYGLSEKNLVNMIKNLNQFRPKYIRGYASSIYTLASFIKNYNFKLNFSPRAIFTTAEKLYTTNRKTIEEVFDTEVFDNYGLNDGGVSAYECKEHCGMHIDMERSILEVVDENNKQVVGRPGRILATSLYNFVFPFIRYETGDIGIVENRYCSCGRELPILKEIIGRTTDVIKINGRIIGSPVLTVLFGKFDIEQYQIIQEKENSLVCKIVRGKTFNKEDELFIKKSLISHVGSFELIFQYVDSIIPDQDNKYKFIINKVHK
jgi:phenylacetate-CoA ligase